jgi:hypothetical protein
VQAQNDVLALGAIEEHAAGPGGIRRPVCPFSGGPTPRNWNRLRVRRGFLTTAINIININVPAITPHALDAGVAFDGRANPPGRWLTAPRVTCRARSNGGRTRRPARRLRWSSKQWTTPRNEGGAHLGKRLPGLVVSGRFSKPDPAWRVAATVEFFSKAVPVSSLARHGICMLAASASAGGGAVERQNSMARPLRIPRWNCLTAPWRYHRLSR